MRRFISVLALACLPAGGAWAATISNTFDTDAQGWTGNVPEGSLSYSNAGGNPGGHVRVTDTGAGGVNGFASGAFFGPDFSGDLTAYDGGTLRFDLRAFSGGGGTFDSFGRILLFGTGDSNPSNQTPDAIGDVVSNATGSWVSYSMTFDAATFGVSQTDWTALLSDVFRIGIATDAFDGGDTIGIDNVSLVSADIAAVPLPASWLFGLTALAGLFAMRRRG